MSDRTCCIDGCARSVFGHGWCSTHYQRWRNHGSPHWEPPSRSKGSTRLAWLSDMVANGDRSSGCWEWPFYRNAKGYGTHKLWKAPTTYAHRLAFEMDGNEIPDGHVVRHKCDNPSCCNPDHLEVGSYQDNSLDMVQRRRNGRAAKLTPEQVNGIVRPRLAAGDDRGQIAADVGVTRSCIASIARGATWAWLPETLENPKVS